MFNFKVKRLDNVKFSVEELHRYYNKVKEDFQNLKWIVDASIDVKDHDVSTIYSWAIQSNLKNPAIPCPPYHIKEDDEIHPDNNFNVPTELIFGFAKKIIDTFPNVRQTVIAAHPPGTRISLHIDNTEFVKIHIPIITTDKSFFKFDDESFVFEVGHAYLVNTTLPHGTENLGDKDRVHLIFKIPCDTALTILNREWTI